MALKRYNGTVEPFAKDATGTNRTVFGDTLQSNDINDNLNIHFKKGWEIVGINDNPTKQDFNGLAYTVSSLVAYLYQQGIAEYNSAQKYMVNSIVIASDGKLYRSLTGNDTTPNVDNNPLADRVNWKKLSEGDNTQRFKVADAVNDDEALSKGQLLAEIRNIDGIDADTVDGVGGALLGIGGAGYSWVNKTSHRAFDTVYTNTTGSPIQVSVSVNGIANNRLNISVYINNSNFGQSVGENSSSYSESQLISFIVPNGDTYEIRYNGVTTLNKWFELTR